MKYRILAVLGTLAGVSLTSMAAQAQALRPNILVLFDTSGSMLYNQANDGSPLCANNANGQTSRVYNMKNALRAALAQAGTDEANFGLMRFPQIENAATANCPAAHWSNAGTAVNGNIGCRMTTQSTATPETTYGTWFDNGAAQSILIPVTQAATGLKALAGTDYDPTGANITSVYRWIDQSDSGMTGAANPDPELRIPPNTNTPLGRSLFYARLYFENYVYPNDPRKACRQNVVIIATDGAETCDTTKPAGATLNTATCAQTPAASYGTFHPELQACLSNHSAVIPKGILTYILTDNGLTNAEKATANLIAAAGGTNQAIFVTLTDTNAVKQALVDIIAKTVPPSEVCNGVDDNCNGLIDEGVSNMCPVSNDPANADNQKGTGAAHCALETCNCKDDNCNGVVDEGFPPNACGAPCGCAVPTEKCNGLDDNCDGNIDEGFMVGASCVNAGVGACKRGGILACKPDGTGTFCDAPVVPPTPESCNNIDDNCDGQVDNGTLPGVGEACGNGLGTCQTGTFVCINGQLKCNTTSMPKVETCNGLDDDCDGVIDNGTFPTVGQDCVCAGLDPAKIGVGVCKGGKNVCRGTAGIVCEGCVGPSPEICDGKDNDCDGVADTNAKCPSSFGCREGACTLVCKPGEFPCPNGYKCISDYCIPQRCATVSCPTGQHCDEATGNCVDQCAGVVCNAPSMCIQGSCVNCETLGCDPGQVCYQGSCRVDKCAGVKCAANEACSDGKCIGLCPPDKCGATERCVNGQCLVDKCTLVSCGQNQFCDPADGKCKADACDALQCPSGERCVSTTGKCAPDPCRLMQCPADCWQCGVTTDGTGICQLNGKCTQEKIKVGQQGGGCACALDADAGRRGAPWTFVWLGLVAVVALRRRRAR